MKYPYTYVGMPSGIPYDWLVATQRSVSHNRPVCHIMDQWGRTEGPGWSTAFRSKAGLAYGLAFMKHLYIYVGLPSGIPDDCGLCVLDPVISGNPWSIGYRDALIMGPGWSTGFRSKATWVGSHEAPIHMCRNPEWHPRWRSACGVVQRSSSGTHGAVAGPLYGPDTGR